jgi:hypothetical protein
VRSGGRDRRALTAYFQIALALIYLPTGGMLRALVRNPR